MSLFIQGVDFTDGRATPQKTADDLVSEEGFAIFGTGIQGLTGISGSTGVNTGTQGMTGVGITGIFGVTGIIGIDGATGIAGDIGQTGITGPTGINVGRGVDGLLGATGLEGVTGIHGNTGIAGLTGLRGTTGSAVQGATGVRGLTGVGLQGFTGLFGETGVLSATGVQGSTGVSLQGVTGIDGATVPGATGILRYRFLDYQQQTSGVTLLSTITANTLLSNDALEWSAWALLSSATTLVTVTWGGQTITSNYLSQPSVPVAISGWITRTGNNAQQSTAKISGFMSSVADTVATSVNTTTSNPLIISLASSGAGHVLYALAVNKVPGTS